MLLQVSITDPNPQIAAQLADAMAGVLNSQLEALAPPAVNRGPVPTAQPFEPAAVPAKPVHIDHIGRVMAAATFALVATAAGVLLIEGLAISARDPEQVAAALALPVLGTTDLA